MVNIADLYQPFGEIAGIDVPASVPRRLDARSMLPYLEKPEQGSIRSWNFTQVAPNLQNAGATGQPRRVALAAGGHPALRAAVPG
jgi:hypothetical protein